MASDEEEKVYWVVFGATVALFYIPMVLILLLRKRRLIRIRHVGYTVEYLAFIAIYSAFSAGSMTGTFMWSCDFLITVQSLAMCKSWFPFLLLYRRIFLRYRFGVMNSIGKKESELSRLGKFSLKYCVYRQSFERELRFVEAICFLLILTSGLIWGDFHTLPEMGFKECMVRPVGFFMSYINLNQCGISLLFGKGMLEQLWVIVSYGDRLGIKSMIIWNNVVMVIGVTIFLIITGISPFLPDDTTPQVVYQLPTFSILFFLVNLALVPLVQEALHGKKFSRSTVSEEKNGVNGARAELNYFEQFLYTSKGGGLMMAFLKDEFCAESLKFIQAAQEFREKFSPKKTDKGTNAHTNSVTETQMMSVLDSTSDTQDEPSASSSVSKKPSKRVVLAMRKMALSIYNKFLDPEAEMLINAEANYMERARDLLSLLKDSYGGAVSTYESTFSVSSVATGSTKQYQSTNSHKIWPSNQVAPCSNDAADELQRDKSDKDSTYTKGDGPGMITYDCFDELHREQVELLYMDNFQRFLEIETNQAAWAEFVESAKEIDALGGI